jgi:hypothetical protein
VEIEEILEYWQGEQENIDGAWAHRLDREQLAAAHHTFNLDHPVNPYVGDLPNAPVIILGANGGYSPVLTPTEFPGEASVQAYLARVDNPSGADWTFVSQYYDRTNYGDAVASGQAVLVNACAYRSPKITEEPQNQKLIKRLKSSIFVRRWLLEAVLPLAAHGDRLVVVKRGGQWHLPPEFSMAPGVVKDRAPISPRITGEALDRMAKFLADRT